MHTSGVSDVGLARLVFVFGRYWPRALRAGGGALVLAGLGWMTGLAPVIAQESWTGGFVRATSTPYLAVASNGSIWVAVGEGGAVRTSANGLVSQTQNSGSSKALLGPAFGAGLFVAVGEDGAKVPAGDATALPPSTPKPSPGPARSAGLALPSDLTLAAGTVEVRLVRLEPGDVELGDASAGTATVRLFRPVLMAVNEVTQAAFAAVMGENPSALNKRRTSGGTRTIFEEVTVMRMKGGRQDPVKERRPKVVPAEDEVLPLPDNPVENVTWEQAMEFCARLTRSATAAGSLPAGTVVRLPTEAEWQRAHAGADWTAGGRAALDRVAWTADNAADGHRAVRTRAANPAGIHDLDGNVAEWCLDAWNTVLPPTGASDWLVLDPRQQERFGTPVPGVFTVRLVTDSLGRRVVRGGSFRSAAADFLSQPVRTSQASRSEDIGFRVVVGLPVETGAAARSTDSQP
jgi:formylglycine-generating enzyme required for sulfatase activity